jgi:hypothetical protein
MSYSHVRRFIVRLLGLVALVAVSASALNLIWGGTMSYQGYFIDPMSGATLPAPNGILTFGASSSPYMGWVFVDSGINLWKVPVAASGSPQPLGAIDTTHLSVDLAFDPASGALYTIDEGGGLYTIDYNHCPGYTCTTTALGIAIPLPVQGIDFVPGRGIYGADINGRLWLVNPNTLQVSYIGDTLVSGITDLAYDSFSQRLIAVSVGVKNYCIVHCPPQSGMIWSIDPLTAQSVLLNDNAPPIYGLAELTPEPGSIVLFTTGAVGLLAAIRRRVRR